MAPQSCNDHVSPPMPSIEHSTEQDRARSPGRCKMPQRVRFDDDAPVMAPQQQDPPAQQRPQSKCATVLKHAQQPGQQQPSIEHSIDHSIEHSIGSATPPTDRGSLFDVTYHGQVARYAYDGLSGGMVDGAADNCGNNFGLHFADGMFDGMFDGMSVGMFD